MLDVTAATTVSTALSRAYHVAATASCPERSAFAGASGGDGSALYLVFKDKPAGKNRASDIDGRRVTGEQSDFARLAR